MTFTIDTGIHADAPFPDWFVDRFDHLPMREQCRVYAEHIVGEIEAAAKTETARKRLLFNWRALDHIGAVNPDAFDHILIAYADKASAT
jgi:hypothetical protein